jgi:hypothetical protein
MPPSTFPPLSAAARSEGALLRRLAAGTDVSAAALLDRGVRVAAVSHQTLVHSPEPSARRRRADCSTKDTFHSTSGWAKSWIGPAPGHPLLPP